MDIFSNIFKTSTSVALAEWCDDRAVALQACR